MRQYTIEQQNYILSDLYTYQQSLKGPREKLLTVYPQVAGKDDYRAHAIDYHFSNITRIRLGLYLRFDPLGKRDWWLNRGWITTPDSLIEEEANGVIHSILYQCYLSSFFCHEAFYRQVYRELHRQGKSYKKSYMEITNGLIANGINLGANAKERHELHYTMRNTIHSNGVYVCEDEPKKSIVVNGVAYDFAHGLAPRYLDIEFIVDAIKAFICDTFTVIESGKVMSLKHIPDLADVK